MRQPATRITTSFGNHNWKKDQTMVQFSLVLSFFWFYELDLEMLGGGVGSWVLITHCCVSHSVVVCMLSLWLLSAVQGRQLLSLINGGGDGSSLLSLVMGLWASLSRKLLLMWHAWLNCMHATSAVWWWIMAPFVGYHCCCCSSLLLLSLLAWKLWNSKSWR